MGGWGLFESGVRRALQYWQVTLVLWLASALLAGFLALVPAAELLGPSHYTAIREAADGVDLWLLTEVTTVPFVNQGPAAISGEIPQSVEDAVFIALLSTAVGLPAAGLLAAFLFGGTLLVFSEAPEPFRMRRFLWGGWHWWGSFLLLSLIQLVGFGLIFGGLIFGGVLLAQAAPTALWVYVPLTLILGSAYLALFELARSAAVAAGTRNVFRALGKALGQLFARIPSLLVLYGLSLGLLLAVHLVFRLGLLAVIPLEIWPLAILAQQGFVAARLGTRSARLAGLVAAQADRTGFTFERSVAE